MTGRSLIRTCLPRCSFTPAAHPSRHLDGYAGTLQADAYAGFFKTASAELESQTRQE